MTIESLDEIFKMGIVMGDITFSEIMIDTIKEHFTEIVTHGVALFVGAVLGGAIVNFLNEWFDEHEKNTKGVN